ncbi:hypothetical protein J6590_002455 [Homalodisca vitripennis]|nr:hypothetical protein J6590_002455 [Homalodisca vitripennis]
MDEQINGAELDWILRMERTRRGHPMVLVLVVSDRVSLSARQYVMDEHGPEAELRAATASFTRCTAQAQRQAAQTHRLPVIIEATAGPGYSRYSSHHRIVTSENNEPH